LKYNLKNRPKIPTGTILTVEVMENYIRESLRHDKGFEAELREKYLVKDCQCAFCSFIKAILGE